MLTERWYMSTNAKDILRHGGTILPLYNMYKTFFESIHNRISLFWAALLNEVMSWVRKDSHPGAGANKSALWMACWIQIDVTWTRVKCHFKTGQLAVYDDHPLYTGKMVARLAYITRIGILYLLIPAELFRELFILRVKLLKSGNFLKLQVPNLNQKFKYEWINNSCTVTILFKVERQIGYRGSKCFVWPSPLLRKAGQRTEQKEQRVDSNCSIKLIGLRCTLMGYMSSYQIKPLSNQISLTRYYSTTSKNLNITLAPLFITGFTDADPRPP